MLRNPKYLLVSLSTSNVAYSLEQNVLYLHLVFPSISVQQVLNFSTLASSSPGIMQELLPSFTVALQKYSFKGKRTRGDIIQRLPRFSTTGTIVLWTKAGSNMTVFGLSEGKGVK